MNGPVYDPVVVDQRPRRRGGLLRVLVGLIVLAVIVVLVLVLVVNGTSSKSAEKDVSVTKCGPGDGGRPTATGRILNHSSQTSNYVIRLAFADAHGNTVSEGVAPVKSVGAGETATWDLTGARDANGPLRCEITGVSRTHLPGQ